MIEICCPSKSRMTFDDEFIKSDDTEFFPSATIPGDDMSSGQDVDGGSDNNKPVEKLLDEIENKVDEIKKLKTMSTKEDAELKKTVTILRTQLNPKSRMKRVAFKRFSFSILKNQHQTTDIKEQDTQTE